jgi:hypothetical protein
VGDGNWRDGRAIGDGGCDFSVHWRGKSSLAADDVIRAKRAEATAKMNARPLPWGVGIGTRIRSPPTNRAPLGSSVETPVAVKPNVAVSQSAFARGPFVDVLCEIDVAIRLAVVVASVTLMLAAVGEDVRGGNGSKKGGRDANTCGRKNEEA